MTVRDRQRHPSSRHRIKQLCLASLVLLTSVGVPATTAWADGLTGVTGGTSTTGTTSADLSTQIAALAAKIVNLTNRVHTDQTLQSVVNPILTYTSAPSFDWVYVLYGTDHVPASDAALTAALVPDFKQMATLSLTSTSAATSFIQATLAQFQSLNPAVQPVDVLDFIQSVQAESVLWLVSIAGKANLSANDVAQMLNGAITQSLASAAPSIQTMFQAGVGTATGGGDGGGAGSGSAGTGIGAGTGSTGAGGAGSGAGVGGSSGSGADGAGLGGASGSGSGSGSGSNPGAGSGTTVSGLGGGGSAGTSSGSGLTGGTGGKGSGSGTGLTGGTKPGGSDKSGGQSGNGNSTTVNLPGLTLAGAKYGAGDKGVFVNGSLISTAPSIVYQKSTYFPVFYVMNALKNVNIASKWDGKSWNLTVPKGTKVDFSKLSVGKGKIGIYINGKLVARVNGITAADPNTGNHTTYMPIWYLMQALNRTGVTTKWDGENWDISKK